MHLQTVLTMFAILGVGTATFLMYLKRKGSKPDVLLEEKLTLDRLLNKVKTEMSELAKEQTFFGKKDEEWEALYNRKRRIQEALKNCIFGIEADKNYVIGLIKNIIKDILPTEDAVSEVIDLDSQFLDPMVKFEILMYYYKKRKNSNGKFVGPDSLATMIETYHLDRVHYDIEEGKTPSFMITVEDIDFVYEIEVKNALPYQDKLDIVAILLYQKYKGFGCVDTLYEMNIDGFNCGTSGSILSAILPREIEVMQAPRSIWLYYKGKYIHLRFLTFYTEQELRRITLLLCRWNNPGPLTEKRGALVNTTANKSRILAFRPGASEYWAFFLRKFTLKSQTLESLINPVLTDQEGNMQYEEIPALDIEVDRAIRDPAYCEEMGIDINRKIKRKLKYKYKNATIPKRLIEFMMLGQVTCAFTGRQGCGKTTLMSASISPVDARFNIRVLEMAPELYLRELYPERNILSVQETTWLSAAELQDFLKKSDAALSIVGEIATDVIAARMVQMGQVASIFTIFSHHAIRTQDLVYAITNSIVAASHGSATQETVLPQVIDVIKVDIHLDYDVDGNRYIDRITEIIRLDKTPYPKRNEKESIEEFRLRLDTEYYTRMTDRQMFTTRDILKFDKKTFTYHTVKFFSEELCQHMLDRFTPTQVEDFIEFNDQYWRDEYIAKD